MAVEVAVELSVICFPTPPQCFQNVYSYSVPVFRVHQITSFFKSRYFENTAGGIFRFGDTGTLKRKTS